MDGAGGLSDEVVAGVVTSDVAGEFPGLRLWSALVAARPGRSSAGLKQRLGVMSDRFTGAKAVAMRQDAIPHAYRVFFRHAGLDPETTRTPVEQAALDRLQHGRFRSRNRVDDALLVAVVETGVPVWALDDAHVEGALHVRVATADDTWVATGRLLVADECRPLAQLFARPLAVAGVTPQTERMRLFAIAVDGVPAIHVEEALWLAREALLEGS